MVLRNRTVPVSEPKKKLYQKTIQCLVIQHDRIFTKTYSRQYLKVENNGFHLVITVSNPRSISDRSDYNSANNAVFSLMHHRETCIILVYGCLVRYVIHVRGGGRGILNERGGGCMRMFAELQILKHISQHV